MRFYFLVNVFLFFSSASFAQKNIPLTDHFTVEGSIKNTLSISLQDLASFKHYKLDSVLITNHLMQHRSMLKNLKLVLLKDVLSKLEINTPTPKELSEFYFTMVASDGYKVVFSWNELFNSAETKTAYLIIGYNDKEGVEMSGRIALIAPYDIATGRRYVKGLSKIIVNRIN